MIYWIALIAVFGLLACYVALVAWDAKHDVATAPRTDMFLCDKHGAIPERLIFKLGDVFDGGDGHASVCPLCFEDKMRQAKGK